MIFTSAVEYKHRITLDSGAVSDFCSEGSEVAILIFLKPPWLDYWRLRSSSSILDFSRKMFIKYVHILYNKKGFTVYTKKMSYFIKNVMLLNDGDMQKCFLKCSYISL